MVKDWSEALEEGSGCGHKLLAPDLRSCLQNGNLGSGGNKCDCTQLKKVFFGFTSTAPLQVIVATCLPGMLARLEVLTGDHDIDSCFTSYHPLQ